MNKKKLPRAVLQTADEMREAATLEWPEALSRRTTTNELAGARPAAAAPVHNVIEMVPKPETPSAPIAGSSTLPAPTPVGIDPARRRSAMGALSPADGPAPHYVDMFRNNVPKLVDAMLEN